MVSGFLVRHDGALISIDDIILVHLDPLSFTTIPTQYRIMIKLRDNHDVVWNKSPVREEEAKALLHELGQLIREVIEL